MEIREHKYMVEPDYYSLPNDIIKIGNIVLIGANPIIYIYSKNLNRESCIAVPIFI